MSICLFIFAASLGFEGLQLTHKYPKVTKHKLDILKDITTFPAIVHWIPGIQSVPLVLILKPRIAVAMRALVFI